MGLVEQVQSKLSTARMNWAKASDLLDQLKESAKRLAEVKGRLTEEHDASFAYAIEEQRLGRSPNYRDVFYIYIRGSVVFIRQYETPDQDDIPIDSVGEGEMYMSYAVVTRLVAQREYIL